MKFIDGVYDVPELNDIIDTSNIEIPIKYNQIKLLVEIIKSDDDILYKFKYQRCIYSDINQFDNFMICFNSLLDRCKSQLLANKIRRQLYLGVRQDIIKKSVLISDRPFSVHSSSNKYISFILCLIMPRIQEYECSAEVLAKLFGLCITSYDAELSLGILKIALNLIYFNTMAVPYIDAAEQYIKNITSHTSDIKQTSIPPIVNFSIYRREMTIVKKLLKILGYDGQILNFHHNSI